MSKEKKKAQAPEEEKVQDAPVQEEELESLQQEQAEAQPQQPDPVQDALLQEQNKFLRLAAEYDNYRKRTAKEKESIWADAKASVVASFLPVYDNLERALKQDTADEAYKKGVEMTMTQLKDVLSKLGVTEIPALGEKFDPEKHNAVMHTEDDTAEENTVVEVFQKGYTLGDKVLRFAMVKVAN